jgi:hypothetical protein
LEQPVKAFVFAKSSIALICVVPALLAAGLSSNVHAAPIERVYHQNAAADCQGALPAFAGTLRARPLGLGNEGAAPAFVTCSFPTVGDGGVFRRLSTYWTNNTAASITVNCTGVAGFQRGDTAYMPKSVVVAPGAYAGIAWEAIDNGGIPLVAPASMSCSVPPGAVLMDMYIYFDVEIGS